MKFARRDNRSAISAQRVIVALIIAALVPLLLYAGAPSWWSDRGVLLENASADDYAPVNQGQLKNIATAAVAEMDAKINGGAGAELHSFIARWSSPTAATNDFAPVNHGQLKTVAKPFYDRLIALGLVDFYPWMSSVNPPDDFAVANIGQVKNLFSFEIPESNSLDNPLGDRLAAGVNGGNLALGSNAVWNWGGPLAAGSTFERNNPHRVPGLAGVSSVAVGNRHLVVLNTEGIVWTWGENDFGQLGDGTNTSRDLPAPVPHLTDIVSIKAGGRHTLALRQDGTVVAWGYNRYGQLGNGHTEDSSSPVAVAGLEFVRQLSAGHDRSMAIKCDGTVWIWGYDHYEGRNIFHPTPIVVPDLIDVVDLTSGFEHMVAVKADGTVWAWGANHQNQVGNGNPWWIYQNTPAQVPNLANIVKVASSGDHTLALSREGVVWAWGYNANGQLGDGTRESRPGPVQVIGLTDVIAIATAHSYSLAMKSDGSVWAWGDGTVGTLPGTDSRLPQQVVFGLFDSNQNEMDDRWEVTHFGNMEQLADGDFDGDGISNLQEFMRGTDPRDFYNGVPAVIDIVSGNNQVGDPGKLLPKPVTVRVRNVAGQALANAPVDFTISNGTGLITPNLGEPLRSQFNSRTDSLGQASAYVMLPELPGTSIRITASPALPNSTVQAGAVSFRATVRFVLPATPTPTPDPNATPPPTPSPTATPLPPYRYAIIDLGKNLYPIRVNNKGVILLAGIGPDGNWGYFRWKGGMLEPLTYSGPHSSLEAKDINDQDEVVGIFYRSEGPWNEDGPNELRGGLRWPGDRSTADKISAPGAFPGFGPHDWYLTFRSASLTAINNKGDAFGEIATGTVRGFLWSTHFILNSARVLAGAITPSQMSDAAAINDTDDHFLSHWTGSSDTIARASKEHYIGRKLIPFADNYIFFNDVPGDRSGMIDGQAVHFDPIDVNEAGVVVGHSAPSGSIVIRTLGTPDSTEKILEGGSPVAINDHALAFSSAAQSSPGPSPSPNPSPGPSPSPSPAPQILAWMGNALVIWERQPDGETWHPFGLEEMIPSMDGWEYLEPYDMNDTGAIVGVAWYTDPSNPQDEGAVHAFLLIPVELRDNNNDSLITPKQDVDERNEKSVAWIDPHGDATSLDAPVMPQLVLRFPGTEMMALKINWKLKVEHRRRNGRVVIADTALIPAVDANGDQPWNEELIGGDLEIYTNLGWTNELQQNGFFGGNAELTYHLLRSDGTALSNEETILFYIGGKNPDDAKCKVFITQTATQVQQPMAWFAYAIAKHESKDYNGVGSRYNQFWDKAGRFGGVDHDPGEVLWVNNPGEKAPKGFGILQVTGNIVDESADIPRKQLWNWQENIKGGLALVGPKRGIGTRYFERIQRRSTENRTAFHECLPPSIPVASHAFSSADAIQVYAYNGTGAHNGRPARIDLRYPFDPANPCGLGPTKRWFWNPHSVAGAEPYIKKVERELQD